MRTFAFAALVATAAAAKKVTTVTTPASLHPTTATSASCPVACISYDKDGAPMTSGDKTTFSHMNVVHFTNHGTGLGDTSVHSPANVVPHKCAHNSVTGKCQCHCLDTASADLVVVTEVTVGLPNETTETFDNTKQEAFKQAVADTVGVSAGNVSLTIRAGDAGGRRLAAGIRVDVFISQQATEVAEIKEVGAVLQASTFDAQLTETLVQADVKIDVAVQADTIEQKHLATKPAKDCSTVISGALHWAEKAATGNWGPYLKEDGKNTNNPLPGGKTTQEKCIAACNATEKCRGWAWRKGKGPGPDATAKQKKRAVHQHFEKCFLMDAKHVGYAPHDDTLAGLDEFNSGRCTNV